MVHLPQTTPYMGGEEITMSVSLQRRALQAIAESWSYHEDHEGTFCVFCGAQVHNAHLSGLGITPTVTHHTDCIVPEVLAHLAANPQES